MSAAPPMSGFQLNRLIPTAENEAVGRLPKGRGRLTVGDLVDHGVLEP
jgi:hypothetical protein